MMFNLTACDKYVRRPAEFQELPEMQGPLGGDGASVIFSVTDPD